MSQSGDLLRTLTPVQRRLLLKRVDEEIAARGVADSPSLRPRPRTERDPLSFAQERLWFLAQLNPGTAAYHVPSILELRGPLDAGALERAWLEVIRRHEVLRTIFVAVDGLPVQRVQSFEWAEQEAGLESHDVTGLPESERESAARERAREVAFWPFNLERGPLARARLVRLAAERHLFVVCFHHTVFDGWSAGVLTRELGILYSAFRQRGSSPLPPLTLQYADYAAWQREYLSGDRLARHTEYWTAQLAGAPAALDLPTDRPRPAIPNGRGGFHGFVIPGSFTKPLDVLAQRRGATRFMAVLAAFQFLLGRYAGTTDLVVGTPIAGRPRVELEGLVGVFLNALPLRADLSGDPSFAELLDRVRETTLTALAHQDLPFEKLVEVLRVDRQVGRHPVFQVMCSLQPAGPRELRVDDLVVSPLMPEGHAANVELSLSCAQSPDGGLTAGLTYATDLFDSATIRIMADRFRLLLERVAARPDGRLSEIELLTDQERVQFLGEGTATGSDRPEPVTQRFIARARVSPDAVAIDAATGALTYAELDARSRRLASALRRRGLGAEARVAVLLERGPDLVVALLGTLRAGACYVPLDPGDPRQRLERLLHDSGAVALITSLPPAERPRRIACAALSPDGDPAAGEAGDDPLPPPAGSLAYIVYTSGSTGAPKGVMVEHRSLASMVAAQERTLGTGPGDRVLAWAPPTFDASIPELLVPLCTGATVVFDTAEALQPGPSLGRTLAEREITVAKLTPSALAVTPVRLLPRLRTLVLGGEPLPAELSRAWTAPDRRVVNVYGPTECTVRVAEQLVSPPLPARALVPLGRATDRAQLYVLDPGLRPCPTDIPGELFAGGVQVARGYIGRAALTAERFVPDPFAVEPGARLFATGDRARWLTDGTLEFLGRVDDQLKVRGFRIEPGEVESALREVTQIEEAAVTAHGEGGERRLVAYVVTSAGAAVRDAELVATLRTSLQGRLPSYMVPAQFLRLPALPRTNSGKLDRHALPTPDRLPLLRRDYVPPRTPEERLLASIWSEVLDVPRVGALDDFFELGGHSLLAMRVIARVRAALGVDLPVRALFQAATLAEAASALVEAQLETIDDAELMALVAELTRADGAEAATTPAARAARQPGSEPS